MATFFLYGRFGGFSHKTNNQYRIWGCVNDAKS